MRDAGKARTLVARFHSSPVQGLGYCPAEPTALFTTAPPVAASGRSTTETLDQYPRTEFLGSPSREWGGSWDHADLVGGSSGATGLRRAAPNPPAPSRFVWTCSKGPRLLLGGWPFGA